MKIPPTHCAKMKLSGRAARTIHEAVREANGVEVCGFLLGQTSGEYLHVERARTAENIYDSKVAFAISRAEYTAVLSELRFPTAIIGVYHHHYGAPHLSCSDRHSMLLHQLPWLIVGISDKVKLLLWNCFRPVGDNITRVTVEFEGHTTRQNGLTDDIMLTV
jgi:proteasome lid subunit RPN8/RPN11